MEQAIVQGLNAVTYGGLLFLVASGFGLSFGLLRVANLAHGAMYLIGGYTAFTIGANTGNPLLAMLVAGAVAALLGLFLERVLLPPVRGKALPEMLLTLGVAIFLADLALGIWGGDPVVVKLPESLTGMITIGSSGYPVERLALLGIAVVAGVGLHLMMTRTRLGMLIRAGVDNKEMAEALGVNVRRLLTVVFCSGAFLAGMSGALGGSILGLFPGSDTAILLLVLVVVLLGGIGSLAGTIVGSLAVGLLDTLGKAYFPSLSYFTLFAPLAIILLWRPQGLLGRKELA